MSATTSLVRVGRVIKPHGIRGELVVEATGATLASLGEGDCLWVGLPPREQRLQGIRPHAGRLLLRVEGIEDRDAAEGLRDAPVAVPAEDLPPPSADEAYVDDLVGCRLESVRGDELGTVRGIVAAGPRDLLLVESPAGERLVPMARDWLVELDAEGGRIVMDLPAGLLEQDA